MRRLYQGCELLSLLISLGSEALQGCDELTGNFIKPTEMGRSEADAKDGRIATSVKVYWLLFPDRPKWHGSWRADRDADWW